MPKKKLKINLDGYNFYLKWLLDINFVIHLNNIKLRWFYLDTFIQLNY